VPKKDLDAPGDNQSVRALVVVIAAAAFASLASSARGEPAVRPPTCSAADTRHDASLSAPRTGHPVYLRWCGRAQATVVFAGRRYVIRGGHCSSPTQGTLSGVAIGLVANPPAPAIGRGLVFDFHGVVTRARAVRIKDSEIEVPGVRIAASGTVTVGAGLKKGTFKLFGRTAAGPTGKNVSGSFTCGR
jgi:hypothetical protein